MRLISRKLTSPKASPPTVSGRIQRQQQSEIPGTPLTVTSYSVKAANDTVATEDSSSFHENSSSIPYIPRLGQTARTSNRMTPSYRSKNSDEVSTNTSTDHFRVAIRLRPLPEPQAADPADPARSSPKRLRRFLKQPAGHEDDYKPAWDVSFQQDPVLVEIDATRQVSGRTMFTFDNIFQGHQSTTEVYQTVAKPIVDAVVAGRHGTIFAYGQTGSGKTHTMQGITNSTNGQMVTQMGVVQYAVMDILEQMARNGEDREYTLHAQFFEIYNEQIRDLLQPAKQVSSAPNGTRVNKNSGASICSSKTTGDMTVLTVREERGVDGKMSATVNAHKERVKTVEDIQAILKQGNQNRACATTLMNAQSSRSHAIFRLTLESHAKDAASMRVRQSVLNLVDLAGSENSSQSGVTGIRKKEAGKINQSLLSLSRVIHALSLPPNKRPKHIGYRDSKLTRIMQPHLSGNACLAVLCCISQARMHLEETRSTLKFAASAKQIQVNPVVNEVMDDSAVILSLQRELAETKALLFELQQQLLLLNANHDAKLRESSSAVSIVEAPSLSDIQDKAVEKKQANSSLIRGVCKQAEDEQPPVDASTKGHRQELPYDELTTRSEMQGDALLRPRDNVPWDKENDSNSISCTDSTSSGSITGGYVRGYNDADHEGEGKEFEVFICHDDDDSTSQEDGAYALSTKSEYTTDPSMFDFRAEIMEDLINHVSLKSRNHKPPCAEILVLSDSRLPQEQSLAVQLDDAEERVEFLSNKLDATYDVVETIYNVLSNIQKQNFELESKNVDMECAFCELQDHQGSTTDEYDLLLQQCILLKYALCIGVILYIAGHREFLFFILSIFFFWCRFEPTDPKKAAPGVESSPAVSSDASSICESSY